MLQVSDIDAWWARAIAAGAESIMPVQEMFWGARYGQLRDPFGVRWSFNQPLN
jgi:PhnB protein